MTAPFLERRGPWGISVALLILFVFFFLLPFGFQAARLSLNEKENDVKDWLPSDFPETVELDWFGDHFFGQSFVLATWPGCTSGDQRLRMLEWKLRHEAQGYDHTEDLPGELAEIYNRAREFGSRLRLLNAGRDFDDWGGRREKWLVSGDDRWYFVTPDGKLYRWDEPISGPHAALRGVRRALGLYELQGQFVAGFPVPGDPDGVNPFHNDPSLLSAPLFHTIQTGDSIVAELAKEGGPLWPIDLTDESRRAEVARRRAMDRLTGTLFASPIPPGFDWSPESFRGQIPASHREALPERFDEFVRHTVGQWIEEHFGGDRQEFLSATTQQQTDAWYHVFDSLQVPLPPRQTCVLVTLTRLAQDHLAHAIGRGVLGGPRGRLLVLAEESGLRAAPPPSLAPPPFNRIDPDALAFRDGGDDPLGAEGGREPGHAGPAPLRMGGPPVDNIAIDEEGTVTLVRLVGYSVIIGILLSYFCFRSIKLTIMVFVVGGSAALLSMAIVGWTSGRVDAILMSMPSLVYVLGLSGAIHVVNYYRDEVRSHGRRGAPARALRHALLPCSLAAITTAIGLASLVTSNLAPISNFGLYAAVGVIATLAILFSYLPAALQVFPPSVPGADDGEGHPGSAARTPAPPPPADVAGLPPPPPPAVTPLADFWAAVGRLVTRHHALVTITSLVVVVTVAAGIPKIRTTVQLLKLFDSESRIIRDYTWLEENFGKLVPMELVVRVPPSMQAESPERLAADGGNRVEDESRANRDAPAGGETRNNDRAGSSIPLNMLQRAELAFRIRTVIERTLGEEGKGVVGKAMSTDTFLPEPPPPTNRFSPTRTKFNRDLLASADVLRDNDYLRIEHEGPYRGSELWRISLRVAALSDVDYGLFIATLRDVVEPVLRAYDTREALLERLADRQAGDDATRRFSNVLVVGSRSPDPLRRASLLREDGQTVDPENAFAATLGELLRGEPIKNLLWLPNTEETAARRSDPEKWERDLQKLDAVVWLGGEGLRPEDFATAKRFINAQEILHRETRPVLLDGETPSVEGGGPIQVVYTGVVPVVYKAQRTLLVSLTESIALAFVLIAAVMIFLLNPGQFPFGWLRPRYLAAGIAAGAVSMLPNTFPVLLVFGTMGHADILVGIGTMMTASVAMGVAVDDTIHFLSWFRTYLDQGKSRVEAVIETYRRVGPAMTQTTIVGGLGLFVFSLSTFVPTQQFGMLMLILLATALVGDLIFLPAILAGPLGACFRPRKHLLDAYLQSQIASGRTAAAAPRGDGHEAADGGPSQPASGQAAASGQSQPVMKMHLSGHRHDPPHRAHR